MTIRSIVIVGDPHETQVGAHLLDAARTLGVEAELCDTRSAYAGPWVRRKALWWLAGRRPSDLASFGDRVRARVRDVRADAVVTTGLAPLSAEILRAIGDAGVLRLNFLTDDPWNPVHYAPWFLRALPQYDCVFSPRVGMANDLRALGVRHVAPLWFAYNPRAHFPEPARTVEEHQQFDVDVLLAGGADRERVTMVTPLLRAGVRVGLYGGYWSRFTATRAYARGFLDAAGLRRATATARISIGLVRRANRDDHSMRTFEIPAMRGCLLAERTATHEALFGGTEEAVGYFSNAEELVVQVQRLLGDPERRTRLAETAHALVTGGPHTYRDRLANMLMVAAA